MARTVALSTGLAEPLTDEAGEAITTEGTEALTVGNPSVHQTSVTVSAPSDTTAVLSTVVGILTDDDGNYLTDDAGRLLSSLAPPVAHSTTLTVSDWG